MNGNTAGNWGPRHVGALVAVAAVVAMLATAFRMQTYDSFFTGSGPAGSAAYRQEIAFAGCMRSHGVPDFPGPPPEDATSVRLTQNAVSRAADACRQLMPHGREVTDIRIVL